MRRSRAGAIALLLPAVLAPAGCGVRPSGVVEVGDPAIVQTVPDSALGGAAVYLKGPDGVLPVIRATGEKATPGAAIMRLLDGPTDADRAAGLTSDVPNYYGGVAINVEDTTVRVTLTRPVRDFSAVARQQLACTAAHATADSGAVTVVLRGSDTTLAPEHCPF
ncbi:hypothetical protein [Streptomyces sp. BPTC-684]|uniref:hypothetical protein n=1 Tax=Streptomyces sp. BPTC-684 TaxID=3043734 RepID=UPI0024B0B120|nr:hypothetical protein [Streptomyces sp. BPTC-684]WHM35751.1 hypothetical protein QIY60_01745 [Streptomyces sp. BPTC-684]